MSTEIQSSDVYKPVGRRLLVEAAKTTEELHVCVPVTGGRGIVG